MTGDDTPKGVWFERTRKRWRVRLYEGTKVKHRSYHRTREEAVATWEREINRVVPVDLSNTEGQLTALVERSI